ncbi:phosphotransferase enzyme family protein [Ancylobacter terrae]|uniref:phosphotransferase enzyme family protein n=1 Tax=Ancylobacter sp. sgz301288 TaxID=3342077 RepID=UPI00385FFCD0
MLYQDALLQRLETGLRSALPNWELTDAAELRLLTISENATYVVEEAGRRLIVRVHRPGYRTPKEIGSELAWIGALRAEGIVDTPAPVPTRDGALLSGFDDDGQRRHVVAFAFMEGREPDPSDDLVPWFRELGAITARLHAHARSWARPEGFTRKAWTVESILGSRPVWGDWRAGLGLTPDGRAILERVAATLEIRLAAYGMGEARFGLIHADLRLANLLVEGPRLGVIDFDDCGFSWFGFDFAAAVSFFEHEPFIPAVREAWVEGYRGVAPLAREDEEAISLFLMLRRLHLTAWIASHAETPTAQGCGAPYTDGTVILGERFLASFG